MRGSIFDTPGERLFLPRWRTQQCAVTATHQSDTALDQSDGQAAKIIIFPGAAKNALLAEQPLCDFAIAIARQPCVQGPHAQYEATATMARKFKRGPAKTAAFDCGPKSVCR